VRVQQVRKNTTEESFSISLLQGNIPQDEKWEYEMVEPTFEIYESLARQAVVEDSPNLLVLPESALPAFLMASFPDYHRISRLAIELKTPIFAGFPHYIFEEKYKNQYEPTLDYNAAALFTGHQIPTEIYYKNILVPFGERVPFLDKIPILWKLQMGQANFEPGQEMVIYNVDGYDFAPLICFEIAFPYFLRKVALEDKPKFWANITNDAWFHKSIGTHQHAVMAAFRTIETRIPVFRAANTGYSFHTTPDGKIHDKSQLFERTIVTGKLSLYNKDTFYVRYGGLINYIILGIFGLQLGWVIYLVLSKSKPKR
jgi:apolipoprotein N-acyltransferase